MEQLLQNPWLLIGVLVWTLPWKAWALWRAARAGEKIWFVALLVVNTLAILEILYLFVFSKKSASSQAPTTKPTPLLPM